MSTAQSDSTLAGEATLEVEGGQAVIGRTPWQLFWRRFRRDKVAFVGLGFIVLLILLAIFAPVISNIRHIGANQQFKETVNSIGLPSGPTGKFWFGNDKAGRDVFIRTVYGARTSMTVALLATGISVAIGIVLGLIAGFFGGATDTFISRTIDVVMSLPILLLGIGLAAACGATANGCLFGIIQPGLPLVVFIISLVNWTYMARIVRGQTLTLRNREFIEAARSLGSRNMRIMFREILPNLAAPIIVYSTLIIPANILFEAALSFLGVGIPQTTPSWGRMLSDAQPVFTAAPWMMLFPGLALLLTTLAFNLVGDGLRDALDPRTGR
jgi:ABC-type dipeptide/oligopeptide/nickel transport system permease subunit